MARIGLTVATLLLMAGCADTDPYLRPGQWQPTGANARNIAVMVVDKRDLIRGRSVSGTPGIVAATAVTRLWSGKVVPLPTTNSQGQGVSQGRAATAGGETGPGAGG